MATYKEPPDDEYSGAKLTILKMLWDGEWILGDEILKAIKQSYYDRRIRELRDEDGWDIETGWLSNKRGVKRPAYRLVSHNRQGGVKRISISADDRAFVLERDDYSCQLCGVTLKDGMNNPQIDHKVPLIRKGANDRSNYQAICSNCNVIKRGICKKCTLPSCDSCYLAYPEKGASNMLVNLTDEESEYLSALSQTWNVSRIVALRRVISDSLKR